MVLLTQFSTLPYIEGPLIDSGNLQDGLKTRTVRHHGIQDFVDSRNSYGSESNGEVRWHRQPMQSN